MARIDRSWLALGVLSFAMLAIGLDMMVLMVALPELARDLDASTRDLQWITTTYPLAVGALMIPFGALGDRFGRVRLLGWSLLGFAAASLLCAFSGSIPVLVIARLLLGLCAAAAMPLSMGVLPGLFPDPVARERALGIWMAASAAGVPLGPIVGGLLLQNFWWGSAFLLGVPVAVLGAVGAWTLIPRDDGARTTGRLDPVGVLTSVVAFGGLVYAFTAAGEYGWGSPLFLGALLASLAVLGGFLWRVFTAHNPLVPPALLRNRGFLIGTALTAGTMLLLASLTFQYSQLFAVAFHAGALSVGVRLLPVIGAVLVGTRLVEPLTRRIGRRGAAVCAVLLLIAAGAVQALGAHGGYGVFATVMVLLGLGMGGLIPLAMGLAVTELGESEAGAGSALLQSLRQLASALGVAVFGSLGAAVYAGAIAGLPLGGLPEQVVGAVRDNAVAGAAAVAGSAPDLAAPIASAFRDGVGATGWLGCGLAVGLLAICALIPAQSDRGEVEGERADAGAA